MTNKTLILENTEGVAVITFNNPPANTWTLESLQELEQIVISLSNDKANIALVLASNSEKFYSAGADLEQFNHDDKAKTLAMANAFGRAFEALSNYRGVSFAAVTGYAMGGGLEVALCCDIRIAEEHSVMALPEVAVGLLPCGLGTQQLPWLVGEGWAKRMILLGEKLGAQKALEIGLVQEVVETGEARAMAESLAERVARNSPTAVKACKRLIMGARTSPLTSNFSAEREAFMGLWDDGNQREGVRAFLEKRKPCWTAAPVK